MCADKLKISNKYRKFYFTDEEDYYDHLDPVTDGILFLKVMFFVFIIIFVPLFFIGR